MPSAPLRRGKVPQKYFWEGINLNKISKKIISLITMAAFVLTLIPAAAFAAVTVNDAQYAVEQIGTNKVKVTFQLGNLKAGGNTVVWATDDNNADALVTDVTYTSDATVQAYDQWGGVVTTANIGKYEVTMEFATAGDYTIHVGANPDTDALAHSDLDLLTVAAGSSNAVAIYDYQSAQRSAISVDEEYTDVNTGEEVYATFAVKDNANVPGEGSFDVLQGVKVWATTKNANGDTVVSDAVTFYTVDGTQLTRDNKTYKSDVPGNVLNGQQIVAKFAAGGEYTICASAYDVETGKDKDLGFSEPVTVTAPATSVDKIQFTAGTGVSSITPSTAVENGETVDVTTTIIANGLAKGVITATVRDNNGNLMDGQEFTLTAPKAGIELEKTTVKTDSKGQFTIKYTLEQAGPFKVYVESGSFSVVLNLTKAYNQHDYTIKNTTEDAAALLAGNDPHYNANKPADFSSAVQFTIGNGVDGIVTGDPLDENAAFAQDEPAALSDTNYISVKAADGSKLKASDLKLVWNGAKECYTLAYIGKTPSVDLTPGEYTVSVGLLSGDTASATFTIAKFGEVSGLVFDMTDTTSGAAITDQVNLGADVKGTVKYVDENGIEIEATNTELAVGISGSAHNFVTDEGNKDFAQNGINFSFTANDDEKYVGSTITLKAVDAKMGLRAETVLTVVDPYADKTLAFDSNEGETNKNNTVEVSVVDEDGNLANTVNGKVYAYVESQSNDDAKVSVDVPANGVVKGTGDITVYSSAETTAKIVVSVKDANTDALYGATLEYTFGEPDKYADTSVVMTIGSTDYIVNNDILSGDAAPYIDSAWRTMVPVRVLSETFGGEVDFKDNVVTIVNGNKTVVMTIGEETYTVNDEELTMDTAPVIRDNDRAYVPVRFMAEALGYEVTPLQDANGLTAAVVFQK